MVIRVLDFVKACNTSAEGEVIARQIFADLARNEVVKLSFDGVTDVPSSFVNASIVAVLKVLGEESLKQRLIIADVTSQIADMIRRCIGNASKGLAA